MTEAVEMCPHCMGENVYPGWDVEKQGYIAKCLHCGHEIMLCDECLHADDNPAQKCDWEDNGKGGMCFRRKERKTNEREAGCSFPEPA